MGKIEVTHMLDFLGAVFEKEHAYSTINSAKYAIAAIIHIPPYDSLNKHPLINKYMTGIFNLRPPKSKKFCMGCGYFIQVFCAAWAASSFLTSR